MLFQICRHILSFGVVKCKKSAYRTVFGCFFDDFSQNQRGFCGKKIIAKIFKNLLIFVARGIIINIPNEKMYDRGVK